MTYNFICKDCKKQFDVAIGYELVGLLNLSCPDCKSKNITRKYSVVNFILKGKGWGKDAKE